ncbi:hypothetical protein ACLB2K_070171 [Fragaria x ananassa]
MILTLTITLPPMIQTTPYQYYQYYTPILSRTHFHSPSWRPDSGAGFRDDPFEECVLWTWACGDSAPIYRFGYWDGSGIDSGLLSVFTDLFVDKPKPQPAASQSKPPPPQPKQQPPPQPKPQPPPPPPQPASESGPAARRQDELVKRFLAQRSIVVHTILTAAQDSMMINVDMWFDRRFIPQKSGIQVKPDSMALLVSASADVELIAATNDSCELSLSPSVPHE